MKVTYVVNRPLQLFAILIAICGLGWAAYCMSAAQYYPNLFFAFIVIAVGMLLADKSKKKKLPNKFT